MTLQNIDVLVGISGEKILDEINQRLARDTGAAHRFSITPDQLESYLLSLELPLGFKVESIGKVSIQDSQLLIEGATVAGKGQSIVGSICLANDDSGGLRVVSHEVKLPFMLQNYEGEVKNTITLFNTRLTVVIDEQIDQAWYTSGFKIAESSLEAEFKRRNK